LEGKGSSEIGLVSFASPINSPTLKNLEDLKKTLNPLPIELPPKKPA